jgi:uncharacterized protein YdaU (DUF1376 family)
MSAADVGAYIRLLCYQWNRGDIPTDDPSKLSRIAGIKVSADVLLKFPNGKNPRMESVRQQQEEFRAERAKAGAKGAATRWQSHSSANGSAIAQPMANAMANAMAKDGTPSPTPSPSKIHTSAVASEVYALYPKKVGREDALKAITKQIKAGKSADHLKERTRMFNEATACWPHEDRKYIPHASTWFNRGSFDDDPSEWKRQPAKSTNPKPDRINFETDDYSKFQC